MQKFLKDEVYHYHSKIVWKKPGEGGFDWHQDYSYWADQYSKPDMISMSIFVDDISPHNAPIMVIPGSHKRGLIKVPHRDKMSVEEKRSYPRLRRDNLPHSLPNEIIREEANKNKIIDGVGSTGSVFIFHSNTFHASNINLSLFQIFSFNIGVEFGQIAVLIIVFPLLSMIRGKFFDKISKFSNWILVVAGMILLVYQLNGYFTNHTHQNQLEPQELQNKQHIKLDTNSYDHKHDHNHDHDHPHDHHHGHAIGNLAGIQPPGISRDASRVNVEGFHGRLGLDTFFHVRSHPCASRLQNMAEDPKWNFRFGDEPSEYGIAHVLTIGDAIDTVLTPTLRGAMGYQSNRHVSARLEFPA